MATETELVNACVAAIAADGNLHPHIRATLDAVSKPGWLDNGTPDESFHTLRRVLGAIAPFFDAATPDHAQSELIASFDFSQSNTLFKDLTLPTDHEIQGVTRPDTSTWRVATTGLYEINFEFDLGVPTSSGITAEFQCTAGGISIPQSLVQEGMHTVTGQDQIVHPGFLVTVAAATDIKVQARAETPATTWNVDRGHFKIIKRGG